MNTIALFERPLLLQVNVSMHYTCVRMPVAAEVVQSNGHFLVAVRCCLFSTRAATWHGCTAAAGSVGDVLLLLSMLVC